MHSGLNDLCVLTSAYLQTVHGRVHPMIDNLHSKYTHSISTLHLGMTLWSFTRLGAHIHVHRIPACVVFTEAIEDNLTVHARMHTGDKVGCHLCHASYVTKLQLQNHIKTKHYKSDGLSSQLTPGSLSTFAHQFIPPVFPCTFCGKPFSRKDNLTVHLRMHTGDKLRCHLCHASYVTKRDLQNHIKTKHDKSDDSTVHTSNI